MFALLRADGWVEWLRMMMNDNKLDVDNQHVTLLVR